MRYALALFAALLAACSSGGFSPSRSPAQLRADATAAVLRAQADGLQSVQAANDIERQQRDATAVAANATQTVVALQRVVDATATWVARPTSTSTPEPTLTVTPSSTPTAIPSHTPTVAPTVTSRAVVVVVEVTATAQPVAVGTTQPVVAPVVLPLAGAIGSIVVSLILLLIVLRVLKVMQTNGD